MLLHYSTPSKRPGLFTFSLVSPQIRGSNPYPCGSLTYRIFLNIIYYTPDNAICQLLQIIGKPKTLTNTDLYNIIWSIVMERCPSGLRSRSWKPVILQGTVGSNPTLSAKFMSYMEKYSSWWRGAPAKGVGRVTGARVRIPLSPPKHTQLFFECVFCLYQTLKLNLIFLYHFWFSCI